MKNKAIGVRLPSPDIMTAMQMDLPMPAEFYSQWVKRSKLFEWKSEGLRTRLINGQLFIHPSVFWSFVDKKYPLPPKAA